MDVCSGCGKVYWLWTEPACSCFVLVQVRYDAELAALRSGVERVIVELVVGPKSSAATRKAILPHMDDLAAFLGRRSASTGQHSAVLSSCVVPDVAGSGAGRSYISCETFQAVFFICPRYWAIW